MLRIKKGETVPRDVLRFESQGVEYRAVAGCDILVTIDQARNRTRVRCWPGDGEAGLRVDTASNTGPLETMPRPLELEICHSELAPDGVRRLLSGSVMTQYVHGPLIEWSNRDGL